jgi:hypothetical protein
MSELQRKTAEGISALFADHEAIGPLYQQLLQFVTDSPWKDSPGRTYAADHAAQSLLVDRAPSPLCPVLSPNTSRVILNPSLNHITSQLCIRPYFLHCRNYAMVQMRKWCRGGTQGKEKGTMRVSATLSKPEKSACMFSITTGNNAAGGVMVIGEATRKRVATFVNIPLCQATKERLEERLVGSLPMGTGALIEGALDGPER